MICGYCWQHEQTEAQDTISVTVHRPDDAATSEHPKLTHVNDPSLENLPDGEDAEAEENEQLHVAAQARGPTGENTATKDVVANRTNMGQSESSAKNGMSGFQAMDHLDAQPWSASEKSRLARMEASATKPDVLRSVPAGRVLAAFGKILWSSMQATPEVGEHVYKMSFPVKSIDEFWSHSWHANSRHKVLTLLLHYNGPFALTFAVVASISAFVLSSTDYLPPFVHRQLPIAQGRLDYASWSLMFGAIVFFMVLFTWRSNHGVFLDKVCIHQTDIVKKLAGVQSIGVFLLNTKVMMILWDPTYFERLWCVYELACYIKYIHSTEQRNIGGRKRRIVIFPIYLGSLIITLFLAWTVCKMFGTLATWYPSGLSSGMTFAIAFHFIRKYQRSLHSLNDKLMEFRVASAKCFCCSVDHVLPDGTHIPCDRKLVEACITDFFRDAEHFEEFVKEDLLDCFEAALGRLGLPYRWSLLFSLPSAANHLDWLAGVLRDKEAHGSLSTADILAFSLANLALFFFFIPLWLATGLRIAERLRTKESWPWNTRPMRIGESMLFGFFTYLCMEGGGSINRGDFATMAIWRGGKLAAVLSITTDFFWFMQDRVDRQVWKKLLIGMFTLLISFIVLFGALYTAGALFKVSGNCVLASTVAYALVCGIGTLYVYTSFFDRCLKKVHRKFRQHFPSDKASS